MILNCSFLVGEGFEFIEEGHVTIEDGVIVETGDGFLSGGIDHRRYIVMPGLINAHTHMGDSFAKEASVGLSVGEAVGKRGIKWDLYSGVGEQVLLDSMRDSIGYMLNSGITTFADFREFGVKGINQLKDAMGGIPIKAIILGRDLDAGGINVCNGLCDGLGLNTYQLDQIPDELDRKGIGIIAIHAGEAKNEIKIALNHDPDIIVHFTNCDGGDIKTAADKGISVVVCPRSNASLGVGFPPIKKLLDGGINTAIGTDNVMINSPDMFREMEFLVKFSCLDEGGGIPAEDVLKMATVNAAKAFGLNSGVIERGRAADLIFIDANSPNIRYNKNPVAAVVNRCQPENVRKVMIDGRFVIDKDI